MLVLHSTNIVRDINRIVRFLAVAILFVACFPRSRSQAQQNGPATFHINAQRLQSTLEKLSEFGKNPEGGVTRLGFSETEMDARAYMMGLMKEAGLEVRVDPAGNI